MKLTATHPQVASVATHAARPLPSRDEAPRPERPKAAEASDAALEATDEQLRKLADETNAALQESPVQVRIERHSESNRFVVQVVDQQGEIVNQFPSEDFLSTAEQLAGLRGMLFQGKG